MKLLGTEDCSKWCEQKGHLLSAEGNPVLHGFERYLRFPKGMDACVQLTAKLWQAFSVKESELLLWVRHESCEYNAEPGRILHSADQEQSRTLLASMFIFQWYGWILFSNSECGFHFTVCTRYHSYGVVFSPSIEVLDSLISECEKLGVEFVGTKSTAPLSSLTATRSSYWEQTCFARRLKKVIQGMSKEQVLTILGEPSQIVYPQPSEDLIETWQYDLGLSRRNLSKKAVGLFYPFLPFRAQIRVSVFFSPYKVGTVSWSFSPSKTSS